MTWIFLRRAIIFKEIVKYNLQQKKHNLSLSNISRAVHNRTKAPLFSKLGDESSDYKIEIVDDETWQVSTGFADAMKYTTNTRSLTNDGLVNGESNGPDFDEIDDLRICGNLFYKLDRDSKEYEEYKFDFHRRKSSSLKSKTQIENISKKKNENKKVEQNPRNNFNLKEEEEKKKQIRVPTFNQMTAAYHEPFCLDIYISKASVRACIIHRATSKVVVVAHSISKDLKFDLRSTKNVNACVSVGKVLAQRALADDIHNVVYTPRKGDKLEGKLQSVLDSVIKNGVWVKVKIKQKKAGFWSSSYNHS